MAEEFRNALRYIDDSRFVQRVCAVNMRKVQELSVEETAANMLKSKGLVSKWTARYEEGGLDALSDLPRSGRPMFVNREDMKEFMYDIREMERTEPRSVQQSIRKLFGVQYNIGHTRRIMHKFKLSRKSSEPLHVNRASDPAILSWQWRLKKQIPRLEKDNFTIGVFDEANYIHDMKAGASTGLQ